MPYFAVAAVYSGEQNGLNQIQHFRVLSSEILYLVSVKSTADSQRFFNKTAVFIGAEA